MQIKLKNNQIAKTANLLFGLTLKGQQSRKRTKFVKLLNARLDEINEEEQALLKDLCHTDDEGNVLTKLTDHGSVAWDFKDEDEFVKEITVFHHEENTFGGGDHDTMLRVVGAVLLNCDVEFSGQDAVFYDEICEIFEEALEPSEPAEAEPVH